MRHIRVLAMSLAIALAVVTVTPAHLAAQRTKATDPPPKTESENQLNAQTLAGLTWRNIGPALMSGRIADIAVHPHNTNVWYVAVGSGGVWKTVNNGTTWTPIFDDQPSYSIGCVTIDPTNPNVIWVGSGENVGGRHVGYGDGIYKSLDAGTTWSNMGLADSEHIGNIIVDPRDAQTVYVSAQGPLWSAGGERGLYKTTDGGTSWEKILGEGEYVGVNEVHFDPRNPDVLYASTHERFRNTAALINGGPGSGIHKSTDGGATWRQLTTGLPTGDLGKIGLAISPQRPDVVYATIEAAEGGGFYRSEDGGASWEKRNDYLSSGTGPHYYQEIFADPHRFDRVYQMDPRMHVTDDGGRTFRPVGEEHKHGDNHALAFHPGDPDYLLSGSDGGLYQSWDQGRNWRFIPNLPVTQFYKLAVDNDEPFYNVYGGTQDNNTQGGPSRTNNTSGIRNSDWFITLFADGHQPAVDPSNPDIVYSEWQQGNLVRYDRKTGEIVYIQPQPEPGDAPDRFNWDSPILISPHDPARLYYASQRVFRSDDRGDTWRPISDDLSRGVDRLSTPMMGRVQSIDAVWDLGAMSWFGNVTSLAESPLVEGLLYAGTDDGLIQVTEDGGENWRVVDGLPGVPSTAFVNNLVADLFDADTVYAALDNHKTGDLAPYLLRSDDRGRSWRSIAGDADENGIPARHIVWRLVQDHQQANLLFAATEFGVFTTIDGGGTWIELGGGMPTIPIRDITIQRRENDLVAASFGRGFFVLDDLTPLRTATEAQLANEATLFPVRDTWWYIERRPLGRGAKATQGAGFYNAPNPPFGAVVTYHLRDGLETQQQARRKAEQAKLKERVDTPYPGWDALRDETLEPGPEVLLTVRDASGAVIRHINGPATAGLHRVAWDLRYPAPNPIRGDIVPGGEFGPPRQGALVVPGTYSVSLALRRNGELMPVEGQQTFDVKSMSKGTLDGASPAEMVAFTRQLDEVNRQAGGAGELLEDLDLRLISLDRAFVASTMSDPALRQQLTGFMRRLDDIRVLMFGNQQQGEMGEATAPGLMGRLGNAQFGNIFSTYGPTPTHRRSLELATEGLDDVRTSLNSLLNDLEALETKAEAAGVPWTPGRPMPGG